MDDRGVGAIGELKASITLVPPPTKMLLPMLDLLAKPILDLIHKDATRSCIRGMRAEPEGVR